MRKCTSGLKNYYYFELPLADVEMNGKNEFKDYF